MPRRLFLISSNLLSFCSNCQQITINFPSHITWIILFLHFGRLHANISHPLTLNSKGLTYKYILQIGFLLEGIHGNKREVMLLKKLSVKIAVLLTILEFIVAGCASQTVKTSKEYDENWRFVPRVHVQENSFGVMSGSDYWGCSYDTLYEGYWCPVR